MSETAGMRLKVKTEELIVVSGEVESQINAIRQQFNEVENIVNKSVSYWEGEGQASYIQAYRGKRDDIENSLRRFSANVTSLRTIAGIYEAVESAATDTANMLLSDVIV